METPLVSVKTITYNHAPYIRQCIEGILEQKTTFQFELVIGEDCSTDGTREIVFNYARKYPHIIRIITSDNNVGMKENSRRTRKACRGKYMAFCEGDDFWIDPYKLQKQVDFLEANHDYGLVYCDLYCFDENHRKISLKKQYYHGQVFKKLILANFIGTQTVCCRRELLLQADSEIAEEEDRKKWQMSDYPLWLEIAAKHKLGFINTKVAVYRKLNESASHSKNLSKLLAFRKSEFDIRHYFIQRYQLGGFIKSYIQIDYCREMLLFAFKMKNLKIAREAFSNNFQTGNSYDENFLSFFFTMLRYILAWIKRKLQYISF